MIDFLFAPEGLRHLKMVAVSRSIEVAQAGPREPASAGHGTRGAARLAPCMQRAACLQQCRQGPLLLPA